MSAGPLHVLVVDDSAVLREAMAVVLGEAGGFTVATAADPLIARRRIEVHRPDAIVLDLEMPREDGLSFLKELMASDPIPVVICSSHSTHGSRVALEALHEGAVDVVAKPRLGVREFVQESAIVLADAIRAAARARLSARRGVAPVAARRAPAAATPAARTPSHAVVAIAASTGGPPALQQVLGALPPNAPGVLVVQHMPAGFTAAFARHLDAGCAIEAKEAADGDVVLDGRALIAAGDRHLILHREVGRLVVEVSGGPLVSRHRPSADVLFRSMAEVVGPDGLGVIMTGMGDDGAEGLSAMKRAGASTVAQDEESSVVFGMPREAIARGAVSDVVPLGGLAGHILLWAGRRAGVTRQAPEHRLIERGTEEQ